MRQAILPAATLAAAVGLACLLWQWQPILALVPLLMPGAPAALMLGATLRRGDPYDVLHRYR